MGDHADLAFQGRTAILRVDLRRLDGPDDDARDALSKALEQLGGDASIDIILFACEGRSQSAQHEGSSSPVPPAPRALSTLFDQIESCGKTTVAALEGTAMGAGLQLALACTYRVGVPSSSFGLPEVKLGLLPCLGGTQRLPRIAGADNALDLITSGRTISADEALRLGVLDAVTGEGRLVEDAIAFASARLADERIPIRTRDRDDRIADARARPELFDAFRQANARRWRGLKAPEAILAAVQAAVELPFDEGLAREEALFEALEASPESRAQRHAQLGERAATTMDGLLADAPILPIASIGIVGAGTMGSGIAMVFAAAGLPVTLVETSQQALDRGMTTIMKNFEASVSKGKLTPEQMDRRMASISPTVELEALANVDLVIEAVFEEMAIKKALFESLDDIAGDGAILASNTSFLDLDEIAEATTRPQHVVGLHFFSPANIMRLLEVVRGRHTSQTVVTTAMRLATTIGKVPVLSGNCRGFIANRIMAQRRVQADLLVLEGPTPSDIDKVLVDYGFAMGPFQTADLVGLDVLVRGETERSLRGDLVRLGRLGQKTKAGFYDYDESRKPRASPVAQEAIAKFAASKGIAPGGRQSDEDILFRLLLPVVNEGVRLLEEGIALRASDIDVAAMLGFNWPAYRGGPMFWADSLGLPQVVERLKALETSHGDAFRPAPLLLEYAAQGKRLTDEP